MFLCVPGESGLGKSTLVNSLFLTDLHKDRKLLNAEGESGMIRCFSDDDDDDDDDEMDSVKNMFDVFDCRANQPDGGDHEAHGGHRGEGRETEADHRGHAGVRRRRQQQRVVITHLPDILYILHSLKPFVAQEEVK